MRRSDGMKSKLIRGNEIPITKHEHKRAIVDKETAELLKSKNGLSIVERRVKMHVGNDMPLGGTGKWAPPRGHLGHAGCLRGPREGLMGAALARRNSWHNPAGRRHTSGAVCSPPEH